MHAYTLVLLRRPKLLLNCTLSLIEGVILGGNRVLLAFEILQDLRNWPNPSRMRTDIRFYGIPASSRNLKVQGRDTLFHYVGSEFMPCIFDYVSGKGRSSRSTLFTFMLTPRLMMLRSRAPSSVLPNEACLECGQHGAWL